jgi:phenylalanyl-tRNA synthetase alpha subunit
MSDEYSFFDVPAEETPAVEAQPQPQADPGVSREEFAALQAQLQQSQEWNKKVQQFFAPEPQQQQQPQPQANLYQQVAPIVEAQMVLTEFQQKYPHLVDFQDVISNEADNLFNQAARGGKPINLRQAAEQAVQNFQGRIQKISQTTQQQQANEQLRSQALSYGPTGNSAQQGQPLPATQVFEQFRKTGDAEAYQKYRQQYLAQKGIYS